MSKMCPLFILSFFFFRKLKDARKRKRGWSCMLATWHFRSLFPRFLWRLQLIASVCDPFVLIDELDNLTDSSSQIFWTVPPASSTSELPTELSLGLCPTGLISGKFRSRRALRVIEVRWCCNRDSQVFLWTPILISRGRHPWLRYRPKPVQLVKKATVHLPSFHRLSEA